MTAPIKRHSRWHTPTLPHDHPNRRPHQVPKPQRPTTDSPSQYSFNDTQHSLGNANCFNGTQDPNGLTQATGSPVPPQNHTSRWGKILGRLFASVPNCRWDVPEAGRGGGVVVAAKAPRCFGAGGS